MFTFSDFKKQILPQLIISYTFLVSGLVINLLELLTLLFIWPLSKKHYRIVNYYLALGIWGNLTALAQWWSGSDFSLFVSDEDLAMLGKENAISVLNHHYDIDWLMGWVMCQRMKLLGVIFLNYLVHSINTRRKYVLTNSLVNNAFKKLGQYASAAYLTGSKVFNKSSTKFLPIVGWSFWFNEMLFLKREWESDKKSLIKEIDAILDSPKEICTNITILCEGTRFTPEKHAASMEIAKEKGLPLLKHHLLPRTKGFTLFVSQVQGKVDFLYDITIGMANVNGKKPTLKHIKDGIPVDFQIYLRRIPISSIPTHNEMECADWLQKLYREKDEIFDQFVKTGTFGTTDKIKKHYIKKDKYDLYVSCMWLLTIAVPSIFYLISFLINGAWFVKVALIIFFMIVNYAVKYLISSTDTKKGSSHGLASPKKTN